MLRWKAKEPTELDKAIDKVHGEMVSTSSDDPDYGKMLKHLERLYKLQDKKRPRRVSPDTLALIAGNVVITIVVVGYESKNVITTRAMQFIRQAR